jgi:nuclear transport factor 2 (NTF2) superfamily protein
MPRVISDLADILPPFTAETAAAKVRSVQDTWNARDPELLALTCAEDAEWRDRHVLLSGRAEIRGFLEDKWERERDYLQRAELWTFGDDRVAVRLAYESRDATGQWWRSEGYELWRFDTGGLLALRYASIDDTRIGDAARWTR